jgi:hypothetical protein
VQPTGTRRVGKKRTESEIDSVNIKLNFEKKILSRVEYYGESQHFLSPPGWIVRTLRKLLLSCCSSYKAGKFYYLCGVPIYPDELNSMMAMKVLAVPRYILI